MVSVFYKQSSSNYLWSHTLHAYELWPHELMLRVIGHEVQLKSYATNQIQSLLQRLFDVSQAFKFDKAPHALT